MGSIKHGPDALAKVQFPAGCWPSSPVFWGSCMTSLLFAPAVAGWPLFILRLEGLSIFALSAFAYFFLGFSTTGFVVFFLVPDISFLAYLGGPRLGAVAYNALHSYAGALALGVFSWFWAQDPFIGLSLIWAAHIGFDRMLGYGLKYPSRFQDTHLGRLGPADKKRVE